MELVDKFCFVVVLCEAHQFHDMGSDFHQNV